MSLLETVELLKISPSKRTLSSPHTGERVLLAIDSALGSSVAVSKNGKIVEITNDDPLGHAETVGTMLEEALAEVGADPTEVTGVVAGMGPGPFTGLRVGIAAAQAFALGAKAPLLPLPSHEAVAAACFWSGHAEKVRVVQDAKRRELFVSGWHSEKENSLPREVMPASVQKREGFKEHENDVWPERIPAARLLELAAIRLQLGKEFLPNRALYLRQPDVNLIQVKKA